METGLITNKAFGTSHDETALDVEPQAISRTYRFFFPLLIIAVLFVTALAFRSTFEETIFPANTGQVQAGERPSVESTPSSCMWVDIKGPDGVWTKMCYVPPSGE